jgi:inositol oxygenase
MSDITGNTNNPLASLDDWEDDLLVRYPDSNAIAAGRDTEAYRDYESTTKDSVREFYRLQHINQTYDFVLEKKAEYLKFDRAEMTVWEAFDFLNQLIDDSDPDTDLDQLQHLLQASEAIPSDNRPDWMVLTGLFHDLGKVLCLFGEPQWAVVGDSYPVGCAFSDKIVFSEYFEDNKDHHDPRYNTKYGVYEPNCGLENVHMTWGHDEYIYHIMKPYLPEQALYMLRYHSFYPQHREKAYSHLMTAHDHQLFKAVDLFNPYDLYSKSPVAPNWKELRPYYEDLVAKYLPATLKF